MDNTALASNNDCPSNRSPHSASFRFENVFPTIQTTANSTTVSEASTFISHHIGQSLAQFGLPKEIEEAILAVLKPKTAAKYKSFIDGWKIF